MQVCGRRRKGKGPQIEVDARQWCYELDFENDGFEIDIKCVISIWQIRHLEHTRLTTSLMFTAAGCLRRGDYIQYAFTTSYSPIIAHHRVLSQ